MSSLDKPESSVLGFKALIKDRYAKKKKILSWEQKTKPNSLA
jgi:hypothetical protein